MIEKNVLENLQEAGKNFTMASDCLSQGFSHLVDAGLKIGNALLTVDQVDARLEKLEQAIGQQNAQ